MQIREIIKLNDLIDVSGDPHSCLLILEFSRCRINIGKLVIKEFLKLNSSLHTLFTVDVAICL